MIWLLVVNYLMLLMQLRNAVVVAQLVERSLPIQELRGSNLVIGKKFILNILLSTVLKRRK